MLLEQTISLELECLLEVMIGRAVIDFSAFIGEDKKIIIKELSVIDLDSRCTQHWIFKPPKETSSASSTGIQHDCGGWHGGEFAGHNRWLSKHYHGIGFGAGSADYASLSSALGDVCCNVQLLYAASSEKAKVLETLLDNRRVVFSLESLGCPALSSDVLILPPVEDLSTDKTNVCFIICTLLDSIVHRLMFTNWQSGVSTILQRWI